MVLDRRRLLLGAVGTAGALAFVRVAKADASTQVIIDNFAFSPDTLTVPPGSMVTWTNHDDIPHSIVCPSLNLHSHALDTDQSFGVRFEKAGSYEYNCGLHPHMKGRIVVG